MTERKEANVWLASYPKSGNTWFRFMWNALHDLADGGTSKDDPALSPAEANQPCQMIHFATQGLDVRRLSADELDLLRVAHEEHFADANGYPVLRKTHESYRLAPDGSALFPAAQTRCAIVLIRDPRDVVCSYARHYRMTLDRAITELVQGDQGNANPASLLSRQPVGSWNSHFLSWTQYPDFPVAVFRYEDFLADPADYFWQALRFAGLDVTPEQVHAAAEQTSFDKLSKQEAAKGFKERPAGGDGKFFHSGKSGGWREKLSESQVQRIEMWCRELMARYGYELETVGAQEFSMPATTATQVGELIGAPMFTVGNKTGEPPLELATQLELVDGVCVTQFGESAAVITAELRIIGLNAPARFILDQLRRGPLTIAELIEIIQANYEVTAQQCWNDIQPSLRKLTRVRAIARAEVVSELQVAVAL